ncbi:MAG: glycoside hydrolase family 172 protein [Planctomycetota bacterium]
MQIGCTTLGSLARIRDFRSKRISSFDRNGANQDAVKIPPGERLVLAEIDGPACIKHFWSTCSHAHSRDAMRSVVLRMWWDGERRPSVEVPLADFFGGGFGICKNFWSLPLQMNPDAGRGMNCWFPMPFARHARIEVHNEWTELIDIFWYLDHEVYPAWEADLAYFHAQWRRENPTQGWGRKDLKGPKLVDNLRWYWATKNTTGAENYVILEAKGRGQYVGCHLDVDCFRREKNDWYGEGDDMIFIDGEPWPPSLHGTGTEDYFSQAYCPRTEFSSPYCGLTQYSGDPQWRFPDDWPFRGKNSVYRFHIEDPVRFEKSIRVTIEHGHNNKLSNDYSSTAYWYQFEPHAPFPQLPAAKARLARPDWPEFEPPPGAPAGPPESATRVVAGKSRHAARGSGRRIKK